MPPKTAEDYLAEMQAPESQEPTMSVENPAVIAQRKAQEAADRAALQQELSGGLVGNPVSAGLDLLQLGKEKILDPYVIEPWQARNLAEFNAGKGFLGKPEEMKPENELAARQWGRLWLGPLEQQGMPEERVKQARDVFQAESEKEYASHPEYGSLRLQPETSAALKESIFNAGADLPLMLLGGGAKTAVGRMTEGALIGAGTEAVTPGGDIKQGAMGGLLFTGGIEAGSALLKGAKKLGTSLADRWNWIETGKVESPELSNILPQMGSKEAKTASWDGAVKSLRALEQKPIAFVPGETSGEVAAKITDMAKTAPPAQGEVTAVMGLGRKAETTKVGIKPEEGPSVSMGTVELTPDGVKFHELYLDSEGVPRILKTHDMSVTTLDRIKRLDDAGIHTLWTPDARTKLDEVNYLDGFHLQSEARAKKIADVVGDVKIYRDAAGNPVFENPNALKEHFRDEDVIMENGVLLQDNTGAVELHRTSNPKYQKEMLRTKLLVEVRTNEGEVMWGRLAGHEGEHPLMLGEAIIQPIDEPIPGLKSITEVITVPNKARVSTADANSGWRFPNDAELTSIVDNYNHILKAGREVDARQILRDIATDDIKLSGLVPEEGVGAVVDTALGPDPVAVPPPHDLVGPNEFPSPPPMTSRQALMLDISKGMRWMRRQFVAPYNSSNIELANKSMIAYTVKSGAHNAYKIAVRDTIRNSVGYTHMPRTMQHQFGLDVDAVVEGRKSFDALAEAYPTIGRAKLEIVNKYTTQLKLNESRIRELGGLTQPSPDTQALRALFAESMVKHKGDFTKALNEISDGLGMDTAVLNEAVVDYAAREYMVTSMSPELAARRLNSDPGRVSKWKTWIRDNWVDRSILNPDARNKQAEAILERIQRIAGRPEDIAALQSTKARLSIEQLPPIVREMMGEIVDGPTRLANTIAQQERIITNLTMWNDLALKGDILKDFADVTDLGERFIQLQGPRYGKAAGKYLHPEWHHALIDIHQSTENASHWFSGVNRWAKKMQTVWGGPSTHFNQVVSNFQGILMAGSDPFRAGLKIRQTLLDSKAWRTGAGLKDIGPAGERFAAAKELFGTFSTLAGETTERDFTKLLDVAYDPHNTAGTASMADVGRALIEGTKKIDDKAIQLFGMYDYVAKYTTWLDLLERGGMDLKTGHIDMKKMVRFLPRETLATGELKVHQKALYTEAARIIHLTFPSLDRLPPAVRKMQQAAGFLVNPYVGIKYGQGVNYVNFARMGAENSPLGQRTRAQMMKVVAIAAAATGATQAHNIYSNGKDQEKYDRAWAGTPPSTQQFKPSLFNLHVLDDKTGLPYLLDAQDLFYPLSFAQGNPDRMLWKRMAANMVTSVTGTDTAAGAAAQEALAAIGLADVPYTPEQLKSQATMGRLVGRAWRAGILPGVGLKLADIGQYQLIGPADTKYEGQSPGLAWTNFMIGNKIVRPNPEAALRQAAGTAYGAQAEVRKVAKAKPKGIEAAAQAAETAVTGQSPADRAVQFAQEAQRRLEERAATLGKGQPQGDAEYQQYVAAEKSKGRAPMSRVEFQKRLAEIRKGKKQ